MDKKDPKYESLKSRLMKMYRLAESGDTHEAHTARLAIERICQQYGISIDDVLSECNERTWHEFNIGRSSIMLNLMVQCHGVVTGEKRMNYRQSPRSATIEVRLTAFEYAELKSMFEWHKANFKAEREKIVGTLYDAYIHKHNLFRTKSEDEQEDELELTPEMFERIRKILYMKQALSDTHYHKMIEQ